MGVDFTRRRFGFVSVTLEGSRYLETWKAGLDSQLVSFPSQFLSSEMRQLLQNDEHPPPLFFGVHLNVEMISEDICQGAQGVPQPFVIDLGLKERLSSSLGQLSGFRVSKRLLHAPGETSGTTLTGGRH